MWQYDDYSEGQIKMKPGTTVVRVPNYKHGNPIKTDTVTVAFQISYGSFESYDTATGERVRDDNRVKLMEQTTAERLGK